MKKLPVISAELKEAVKTVLAAKAYTETIRPVIMEIKQAILSGNVYMISDEWTKHPAHPIEARRITNDEDAYLMSYEDSNAYITLLHKAYLTKGFTVPDWGYCPLLMAENIEREALRNMVNLSANIAKYSGLDDLDQLYYSVKTIKKYEELIMGMVLTTIPKSELTAEKILNAA